MNLSNIQFVDVSNWSDAESTWDDLVNASAATWVWSKRLTHAFRLSTLRAANELHEDKSFFLVHDGQAVGLMPMVLRHVKVGNYSGLEASYREAPLPWPSALTTTDSLEIEQLLLQEAETRARSAGAGRISLMLAPPLPNREVADRFAKIIRARGYVDFSYPSHYIELGSETLPNARERYRRNVRKFGKNYKIEVLFGREIPPDMHLLYMDLHRKDAGTLYRPEETFRAQMDALREGDGFITVARSLSSDNIVGILMICLFKDAAYDASVAVDPEYQNEFVSHLLKWKTIEYLVQQGTKAYELGRIATPPNCLWQPSDKNYGISFFKDGWARDGQKTVFEATKFLDASYLRAFWQERYISLCNYQGLATLA